MPSSGAYVCNVHNAEKSPTVHPTRHRSVLIPALFHVPRQLQKALSDSKSLGFLGGVALKLLLCDMVSSLETCIRTCFMAKVDIVGITLDRKRQLTGG
jgi:hypothetical protein